MSSSSSASSALFSIADHQSSAISSSSSSSSTAVAAAGTAVGAFQPARSVGMACRFFVPAHAHAAFVEYLYSKEAVIEIWYASLVICVSSSALKYIQLLFELIMFTFYSRMIFRLAFSLQFSYLHTLFTHSPVFIPNQVWRVAAAARPRATAAHSGAPPGRLIYHLCARCSIFFL